MDRNKDMRSDSKDLKDTRFIHEYSTAKLVNKHSIKVANPKPVDYDKLYEQLRRYIP